MIEATVRLSDTHQFVIADGKLAIEGEGLYEEPLETAFPKLELVLSAAGLAREEMVVPHALNCLGDD